MCDYPPATEGLNAGEGQQLVVIQLCLGLRAPEVL